LLMQGFEGSDVGFAQRREFLLGCWGFHWDQRSG
jgi:hypothetical protein